MMIMNVVYAIALILVVVGAINWALVGFNPAYNLVEMLLKDQSKWVYYLVGLSAIVVLIGNIVMWRKHNVLKHPFEEKYMNEKL